MHGLRIPWHRGPERQLANEIRSLGALAMRGSAVGKPALRMPTPRVLSRDYQMGADGPFPRRSPSLMVALMGERYRSPEPREEPCGNALCEGDRSRTRRPLAARYGTSTMPSFGQSGGRSVEFAGRSRSALRRKCCRLMGHALGAESSPGANEPPAAATGGESSTQPHDTHTDLDGCNRATGSRRRRDAARHSRICASRRGRPSESVATMEPRESTGRTRRVRPTSMRAVLARRGVPAYAPCRRRVRTALCPCCGTVSERFAQLQQGALRHAELVGEVAHPLRTARPSGPWSSDRAQFGRCG
jgi:hypothetical protein